MADVSQKLESDARQIADMYLQQRIDELTDSLNKIRLMDRIDQVTMYYQIYYELYSRGFSVYATNFVCSLNRFFDDIELIFEVGYKVYVEHDHVIGAGIFFYYINNNGSQIYAFESCIMQCRNQGMNQQAIDLHQQTSDRFGAERISPNCLAQVAYCQLELGDVDQAWSFAKRAFDRDMDNELARFVISRLARTHSLAPAIILDQNFIRNLSRSFPTMESSTPGGSGLGYRFDLERLTVERIVAALNDHGLCYIRGGCRLGQYEPILTAAEAQAAFPLPLSGFDSFDVEALLGFDARGVASAVIGAPAAFDANRSALRKVDPSLERSFTPFHQDTTAFSKRLLNVWVPLTPAGGEFPSLQLVAKRIDLAEQTIIKAGEYNQIEISEAHVFERYGDLVVDIDDARPGDCVLFQGTTIHRSGNMRQASRPRFNLEIRWS